MSQAPDDLLYAAETHEWVRVEGDVALVGITDFAQDSLGDLVYAELPAVGTVVTAGAEIAVLESMKTASDIYAPVSGEIVAINEGLEADPELVNQGPYAQGWLFRIRMSAPAELDALQSAAAYLARVD